MAEPLLFAAQAPDLIGYDTTGADAFTSNFTRYAPMPGTRENRFVYTLEAASVGVAHWVDTGNGVLSWLADVPLDANAVGGGPGASYAITTAAGARFHTDNSAVEFWLRFRSREVHCASIEIMHTQASSRNVQVQIDELGGGGAPSVSSAALPVPPNQWTRVAFAYTPSKKPTMLFCIQCNAALGWAAGETVYFRRPMLEPGVGLPGEWFSGSSVATDLLPGPKWIDARSGYQRNPCEGISVAQAGWFLVSANTQLVKNPYGTVDTAERVATNGSLARTTDYAIQGPASLRLTASGANAKDTTQILATVDGNYGIDALVINEQSSARTCRLIAGGFPLAGTTVSVPAYGEIWLRTEFVVAAGFLYVIGVEWTDSVNGDGLITEYLGCLSSPDTTSRHSAYPVPPLKNDGTIDTFGAWTGTAHDSSSTIAGSSLIAGFLRTHARSQRGAAVVRLMRSAIVADERVVLSLGSRDVSFGYPEQLQLWVGPTNPETFVRYYAGNDVGYGFYGTGTYDDAVYGPIYGVKTEVAGQAIAGDSLVDLMMEWDGNLLAIEQLGSWRVEGERSAHPPRGQLVGVLEIGNCQDADAETFDGLISAVAIASRPLTLAEKERVRASPLWSYRMLDDLQPGYAPTLEQEATGLQLAVPTISYTGIGYGGGSGGSWDYRLQIFRADLTNTFIEEITDQLIEGRVDWDDGRDVKGGGSITVRNRAVITAQVDLLAPVLTLTREDGTVRTGQLGLYLTSMPSGQQDVDEAQGVYELRDVSELLSRSVLRTTYNVAGGTTYAAAITALVGGVGLGRLVLPATAATFGAASSQRKGTNRLAILNGWCRALGWQEIAADMQGRLVTEVHRRIRDIEPFMTLTEDDLFAVPEDEPMTEKFGNMVVVRADNPSGTPITVVAVNDDPADPISTVNIGEHPLPDVSDPNITSAAAASDLAERILEKSGSWERVVRAKILAQPMLGINRAIAVQFRNADASLDGRYWVRKWALDLVGDGTMDLELNRVVRRSA